MDGQNYLPHCWGTKLKFHDFSIKYTNKFGLSTVHNEQHRLNQFAHYQQDPVQVYYEYHSQWNGFKYSPYKKETKNTVETAYLNIVKENFPEKLIT